LCRYGLQNGSSIEKFKQHQESPLREGMIMRKKFNSRIIVTICFVWMSILLSLPCGSHAGNARGVTDTTIKLGVLTDFTGSTAAIGKTFATTYTIYFKWINDQGGINGRKVELLFEDSKHDMPTEIAAFRKLLFNDKPLTIITFGTPTQKALFPLYEKEHVPAFAASIAHMLVEPVKPYVFAAVTDYQDTMFLAVDYVLNQNPNARIGMAYVDNPYGYEGVTAAEKRLKKYGKELVTKVVIDWSPVDATTQVLTLKKAGVDYVLVQGIGSGIAALLRDGNRQDYLPTYLGTNQVLNTIQPITERVPDLAKHVVVVSPLPQWHEDAPGIRRVKEIYAKYSEDKDPPKLASGFFQAWVVSMVLTESMKRCGKDLTPERLRDQIEGLRGFDTGGITGLISFGPTKHAGNRSAKLYRFNEAEKRWDPFTDWITVKD
jgi:branched-chain amino acid transport system substrate-binding protein